ncbi:MAG: proline--tRNA ligase [Thaumarchaeota archaeon]|nr:proline--tRNA ligase [Nitrososphaerota archaeon]
MSRKDLGVSVKRSDDFSEWYTQVVLKAELADYAAAKGFIALRPYGYAIWDQIRQVLDERFRATGHVNAYFPTLIPESLLRREAEHFEGFTPEVFWVTRAGNNDLSEKLVVRPTSETIIYDFYARWVRSWRDLPVLINLWNSVLRAEIKSTKPFLRTSEFLWQEGHTVHVSKEEADDEVMRILEIYREIIEEYLAIPTLRGTKSDKEKFVGALYTTTLESMMPDGRALQMGTSHNLGQNFSKPFGIKFLGKDEKEHYAWQTSWGVSWRLIGALIMTHGDDKGLVMPPRMASIQVVFVPVYYKDDVKNAVMQRIKEGTDRLRKQGVRVHMDDREEYTPGWKYHEWELKGVPLRIEVGPRDLEKDQFMLVRRDTGERKTVPNQGLEESVKSILESIQKALFDKASATLKEMTRSAKSKEELKKTIEEKGGFVEAQWCGSRECEEKVKTDSGADIRLIPFDSQASGLCVVCGNPASSTVYFARAY